jgi:hypothetical protein
VLLSSYYNPPVNQLQPWTWTQSLGGTAYDGAYFNPNGPNSQTPYSMTWAFIQTDPFNNPGSQFSNMSTTLVGMTAGSTYNLSFVYSTRAGYNATQDQLTVFVGGLMVYQTGVNVSDVSGWMTASATFTAPASSAMLVFAVDSTNTLDRAILVGDVLVQLPNYTPQVLLAASQGASFESPNLNPDQLGLNMTVSPFMSVKSAEQQLHISSAVPSPCRHLLMPSLTFPPAVHLPLSATTHRSPAANRGRGRTPWAASP